MPLGRTGVPHSARLPPMPRRFISLFLVLSLLWQALAYAGGQVWLSEGVQQVHALLHFEEQAHHHGEHPDHDGDGDVHLGDSLASVQHAMHDASVFAPVLLIEVAQLSPVPLGATRPIELQAVAPPLPFLSGPERPPNTLA